MFLRHFAPIVSPVKGISQQEWNGGTQEFEEEDDPGGAGALAALIGAGVVFGCSSDTGMGDSRDS